MFGKNSISLTCSHSLQRYVARYTSAFNTNKQNWEQAPGRLAISVDTDTHQKINYMDNEIEHDHVNLY